MASQYTHPIGHRASLATLHAAGLSPDAMRRMRFLRWRIDTGHVNPATPFGFEADLGAVWFAEDERAQLRFLKWRIEHGAVAEATERTE